MGSARRVVGGAEILIAPSDLLRIIENPEVFQHFHILGLIGSLWGPPGAYSESCGASRCSFGAIWSLQMLIWSPLEPPDAHLEPFNPLEPPECNYGAYFHNPRASGSLQEITFHHPGAQSVYYALISDPRRHWAPKQLSL